MYVTQCQGLNIAINDNENFHYLVKKYENVVDVDKTKKFSSSSEYVFVYLKSTYKKYELVPDRNYQTIISDSESKILSEFINNCYCNPKKIVTAFNYEDY